MILQKNLKTTEANKNKNEAIFKLQGQSAISKRWLDFDFDRTEKKFCTRELGYMGKSFKGMTQHKIQIHLKGLKSELEIKNVWKNQVLQ